MTEKNKYKININPEVPSKESIKAKMDFNGAYQSYSHWIYRTPWHTFQHYASKNKKITMMIILFAVIAMLIVMDYKENKESEKGKQEQVGQSDSSAVDK